MRTIKPLNGAKSVRVGREGDELVIELDFTDGTSKKGRISTPALSALVKDNQISNNGLSISRRTFRGFPRRQRPIDALYIGISGPKSDLAVVSRAAFFEAAGLSR
jgi:hypothetical protein